MTGQYIFLAFSSLYFVCGGESAGCTAIETLRNPITIILVLIFLALDSVYLYVLIKSRLDQMLWVRIIVLLFCGVIALYGILYGFSYLMKTLL
jgi:hypothetical protein